MTVGMNYDAAANVRRLLRAVWPDPVPVDPDEGLKAARLLARGARLTGLGGFPALDAWPEALRADKAGEAFHDRYREHPLPAGAVMLTERERQLAAAAVADKLTAGVGAWRAPTADAEIIALVAKLRDGL